MLRLKTKEPTITSLDKSLKKNPISVTYIKKEPTEKQKLVAVEENVDRLEKRLNKLKEELESIADQKAESIKTKEEKRAFLDGLSLTELEDFERYYKNHRNAQRLAEESAPAM